MNEHACLLGLKIRQWRHFRNFKQEVFAREIGVSRIMLSRYENGRSKVPVIQLQKIATILEVEISALLH
jgi:transcriptional regulator with XRE-family HTH domain